MFKHTVVFLLLSILFAPIVHSDSEIIGGAELREPLEIEQLIDQQLYWQYQRFRLQRPENNAKALGGAATINGHVEDIATVSLAGHDVTLYELLGNEVTYVLSELTDMNGDYSFTNLTAGIYLIFVGSQSDEYLDYVWQSDVPLLCNFPQRCSENISSHINLPDAATLNNFDFSIALGGKINGTIIDAGTLDGIGTLTVELKNTDVNPGSSYLFTSIVDQITGSYSIKGVPDGNYRVYLQPRFDLDNLHIPQVFGGPECNLCIREVLLQELGSIVNIANTNNVENINFFVNTGASIGGFIVDNNTTNPLAKQSVIRIYSEFNYILGLKTVNGTNNNPTTDGGYIFGGLVPGSYYVQADNNGTDFYQRKLYNNKPCHFTACNRGTGDAVVLAAKENKSGINFLLDKGGKISGTITDALTGLPLTPNPFELLVEFYDNTESVVGSAFVETDGNYISWRAIPAGTYSVRTGSMYQGKLLQPYVNQKYPAIDCAGLACDLSATNIVVTNDTTTSGIDFALSIGNSFSGTVTDLATSAPIGGVHVLVYKEMSVGVVKFANWATSSDGGVGEPPIGTFEVSGLPDGTYFARTGYGSDLPFFVSSFHNIGGAAPIGWIDILYENIPCIGDCDVTLGTPIVLPLVINKALFGQSGINFSLTQGAIITGQAIDFINNAPLPEITINVYNSLGTFMGSSITDNDGKYITRGLPDGTYYLTTTSFDVLLDVKYGNEFCQLGTCNPLDAQPIIVQSVQQTTDKDFVLKTSFMHMFSNDFE